MSATNYLRPTNICTKHLPLNNQIVDILIKSPRITISSRIERILFEKFERLEKITDRIIRCEVVLKRQKSSTAEDCTVESRLVIPGNDLFAKETAPKFEVAAENACLDLERQLRKRKTKLSPKAKAKVGKARQPVNDEELE